MMTLEGMRVAVIAADGFEESELTEPIATLRSAGAEVRIVSPKNEVIRGFKHFDSAGSVRVDKNLADVRADEFDAIHLPGGTMNADSLRMCPTLRGLLQDFDASGRPIAAICHAPWILISAGLVKGRTLTSYHTIQDDVRNAGGRWVDRRVVEDRNWITSRQPDDLPAFCDLMVRKFAELRRRSAA